MKVFLSLIVPVYNVERFLPDCYKSISGQTFRDFEVLLIDDGSTDGSGALCDRYQKTDERFKTIHRPNGGLSAARNTGIREAGGEYLLFIDSDDFLVGRDALERLTNDLIKHPDLLIYPASEWNEDATKLLFQQPTDALEEKVFCAEEVLDYLYSANDGSFVTMAQTKVVRREFCLNNRLFFLEGIYHEDDEWITRTLSFNPSVAFSKAAVYGYRHRQGSIITSSDHEKTAKRLEDRLRIGNIMLNLKMTETHPQVCRYAASYFWGSLCRIREFPKNCRKRLYKTASGYSSAFSRFKYTKKMRWQLLAIFERIIGIKATTVVFSLITKN